MNTWKIFFFPWKIQETLGYQASINKNRNINTKVGKEESLVSLWPKKGKLMENKEAKTKKPGDTKEGELGRERSMEKQN